MSKPDPDAPSESAEDRPRPLMGAGFVAVIAFSILCVLAGAWVGLMGPSLWPAKPATTPASPVRP